MANLKELRNRLHSIRATKKITSAMKIVATAKFRQLKTKVSRVAHYAQKMSDLAAYAAGVNEICDKPPILLKGGIGANLVITFTSDQGLCGGFNSNLAKEIRKILQDLADNNQTYHLMIFGQKGKNLLNSEWKKCGLTVNNQCNTMDDAQTLAQELVNLLTNQIIGKILIIKGTFRSVLHQPIVSQILVPAQVSYHKDILMIEPQYDKILPQVLQHNLAIQLYYAFWDSQICEQASRMTAMDNSTRNAQDMINQLQLKYNRSRQAQITKDLLEIVAGNTK